MSAITREDQNRINAFSSKTISHAFLKEKLADCTKLMEGSRDCLEELELCTDFLDEEEDTTPSRFGDIFIDCPVSTVRSFCEEEVRRLSIQADLLKKSETALAEELSSLKKHLYSKFGDSIQLEHDAE